MEQAELLRDTRCELGEGPLWTGERLVFFDILNRRCHALSADGAELDTVEFDRMASACALTDTADLLVATETDLSLLDTDTGELTPLVPLEADNAATRSNDGRADRQGGFWIGTMGKRAEPAAGAIYRYHRGELRRLRGGVTIPNAICFSPDGHWAYFTDTAVNTIWRWRLDPDGWPLGAPAIFHEVTEPGWGADGAVIDETGEMWLAIWGGGRVLRIDQAGTMRGQVRLPVSRASCPAFGPGGRLFVTTARQGMSEAELAAEPTAGGVFVARTAATGQPEARVLLP